MNKELSEIMSTDGRMVEWANAVTYTKNYKDLSPEDQEISAVMDNWAKEVGRTGFDRDHEISQLVRRAITPETVEAPSALLEAMFDQDSIGEFDDVYAEVAPKNTIQVYDAVQGGNVYRSFVDFTNIKPQWFNLQAETDISLRDMRKGGYKTVANMVNYINEALELNKIVRVINLVDNTIVSGNAGYINEAGANVTETSVDALVLYLADMSLGDTPQIFALNKYIQTIAGFDKANTYANDAVKGQFWNDGFLRQYAGAVLNGFSGQRKLANGDFIIPDKKVFGVAGKIGQLTTRGETQVYQETDINAEKIHIKVGGYSFGVMLTAPEMIGKIVISG